MKTIQNIILVISILFSGLTFAQNDLKARIEFEEAEKKINENNFVQALEYLENTESLIGKWTPKVSFMKIEALNEIVDLDDLNSIESKKLITEVKLYMNYSEKNQDNIVMEKFKVVYALDEKLKQLFKEDLERKMLEYTQGNQAYNSQNYTKAMEMWGKAAAKGNGCAMYEIGFAYDRGIKGYPSDLKIAMEWYLKAAEKNNEEAMYHIGVAYYYGEGATKDYNIAMEWYLKAAAKGHARSMNKLGNLYYFGLGVPKDYNKSFEWYQQAAKVGDAEAMYRIGIAYDLERGAPKDNLKAMEWYSKSAKEGNKDAMNSLGILYYYGSNGVTKDYTKAMEWYLKAAKKGNINSMYNVGEMYQKGEGIAKDYAIALEWYLKANSEGKVDSLKQMAVIYEDGGYGIKRDKKKSADLLVEYDAKKEK